MYTKHNWLLYHHGRNSASAISVHRTKRISKLEPWIQKWGNVRFRRVERLEPRDPGPCYEKMNE
jgi:hypothetical protein